MDLASLFLDLIYLKHCKSHDKYLEPAKTKTKYKSGHFLSWSAEIFDTSVLANFEKYLFLMEPLHFWTG